MPEANAAKLVAHLGASLGLPALQLDPSGGLAFQVGEQLVIHLQHYPADDAIALYTTLGPLRTDSAQALRTLLRANRFWRGTYGATLSLTEQDPPEVVLAQRHACAALTPEQFRGAAERFAAAAAEWRELVGELSEGAGEAGPAPLPPLAMRA